MHVPERREQMRFRLLLTALVVATVLIGFALPGMAGWQTLETDNFYIHFPAGSEALAEHIAELAERIHVDLTERLQHFPSQKTHVVLSDRSDVANAFASPMLYNHIELQTVFPSSSVSYLTGFGFAYDDWLELVFLHEYAHILHMDMRPAVSRALMTVFGRVPYLSFPVVLSPPFVIEGLAVLLESELTGGRGGGAYYDMFLRTAALADALPEIDQVIGSYQRSEWQPTGDIYLYGYAFLDWFEKKYGEAAIHQINEMLLVSPERFGAAVEKVAEMPLDQVWWRWQQDTKRRYMEQVEALAAQPFSETTPLDTVGEYALLPAMDPSTQYVAFIVGGNVNPALRLYDREVASEIHVASLQGILTGSLAWHPEGNRIAVARIVPKSPYSHTQLAEVDVKNGRIRNLAGTQRGFAPSYSPEGDRLVYIARDGSETELRLYALSTGEQVTLFRQPGIQLLDAAWSPDGRYVALAFWQNYGGSGIALLDLVRSEWMPLFGGDGTYLAPAWSPDGRYLLFSSDRTGVFNLYRYDTQQDVIQRMSHTQTGLFNPQWLSDTLWLAVEYTADGYRLVEVRVAEFERFERAPWSVASSGPSSNGQAAVHAANDTATGYQQIRPYSAWPTLLPKYWWPLLQESGGETRLGAQTSGRDVLGRTAYSAEATVGLRTGRLSYRFELEHALGESPYAVFGSVLDLDVQVGGSGQWRDRTVLSAGISRRGGTSSSSHLLWLQGVRIAEKPQGADGELQTGHALGIGWSYVGQGGKLGIRSARTAGLSVQVPIEAPDRWQAVYQQIDQITGQTDHRGLQLALSLGLSGAPKAHALGGETGIFSLRGYDYGKVAGSLAARAAIEGRWQIWRWERGFGDRPIFLRDISFHPFAEVGYVLNRGDEQGMVGLSVGAEIGLRLSLGYRMSETDWRFGVAYGVGEPGPRLYLRIVT